MPESRLDFSKVDPESVKPLYDISKHVAAGTLEPTLKFLVEVRISQINGCSYCVDTHIGYAMKNGENQQRIDLLPYFRELPFYDDREKAALEWAETVTNVRETHVPDEAYTRAREQFSEKELLDLTMYVVMMNGWNRVAISFRHLPEERR